MSFEEHEKSPSSGGPITLYKFVVGPAVVDHLCYTDADTDIFHEFVKYSKTTIKRDEVSTTGSLNKTELKITMLSREAIVDVFRDYPPSFVVTVSISEGHFDDRDRQFLTIWYGRVLNCEIVNNQVTLSCEPSSVSIKRPGLRRNYQRQCPLVLYGPDCLATRTTVSCVLNSFIGNVVSLTPPGGGLPIGAEAYINGIMEWISTKTGRTEIRSVLGCVEEEDDSITITLSGPVSDIPGTFSLVKGCNHTERTCIEWHDNIVNYGGQIWIPVKSPLGTTATFL